MKHARWITAATLLLLSTVVLAREDEQPVFRPAQVPAELLDREETSWCGVYMFGKKVGYGSLTQGVVDVDGIKAVVGRMNVQIKAVGPGGEVSLQFSGFEAFDHAPPHALLRYVESQTQNGQVAKTTIRRAETTGDTKGSSARGSSARGYRVTVEQSGQTRTLTMDALDYTLADMMAPDVWLATKPKVDATIRTRSFDSDTLKLRTETKRVVKIAKSLTRGVETVFYEIESTDDRTGESSISRVTAEGTFISMMLGQMVEVRREPEAQAKSMGASADLFVLGAVKLNRPLGADHPREVTRLVLTIPGNVADELNGVSGQKATFHAGREVTELVVGPAVKIEAKADDVTDCLLATPDFPCEVDAIRALAKQALGEATTPKDQVAKLAAFVDEYIEDSYADNAVAVLDLLKTRKGDCTEHTALFVTLARACGIPARATGGVMYMGDEICAMGGHAWAEVVLEGHWIPVDPTFGEARADAARITFPEATENRVWPAVAGKTLIVEAVTLDPTDK